MQEVWRDDNMGWLGALSTNQTGGLPSGSLRLEFTPGEIIFAPTIRPDCLYLLEEGIARIYRLSDDGAETTFGYVAPGEVFGELAALGDYPRESFAQAVRPCRVWKIPRAVFAQLLADPGIVLEITRQIGARLKRSERRIESLVFREARSRIAHMLLELAEDFGLERDDGVLIGIEFTQAELATLVGTTRQTVNATLREFECEGVVGRQGRRIHLIDLAALRKVVEGPDPD